MKYIRELRNISLKNLSEAGGKGASLGELIKSGINVPEGFVVLTNAFEKFIKDTEIKSKIEGLMKKIDEKDLNSIKIISEKIKDLIISKELPKNLSKEIMDNFKELRSPLVAIRSSAIFEDGSTMAWAGQLDTYLNSTEKNLLKNLKFCWASMFNYRALLYKFKNKISDKNFSLAVIIQKMIQSDKSGIAFSINPITKEKNKILIEASFGLGEKVVSGKVTPDLYIVRKNSLEIIKKTENSVLSKDEIIQLSKIVTKIERDYGFGVDIEWAQKNNNFYILQSRPIST
jgi:pyruvate,water dikinase